MNEIPVAVAELGQTFNVTIQGDQSISAQLDTKIEVSGGGDVSLDENGYIVIPPTSEAE